MVFKVHMGGKRLGFESFDDKTKAEIKERLAAKDPVMKEALETGKALGIKINGQVIDQAFVDSIDLDKGAKISEPKPETKNKTTKSKKGKKKK